MQRVQLTTPQNDKVRHSTSSYFKVCCKGLVSDQNVMAIGVVIYDHMRNVVFKTGKTVTEFRSSRPAVEIKAVVEGLNAAVDLGLKRVVFCFEYEPLYKYVMGELIPLQQTIGELVSQVKGLRENFDHSVPDLVDKKERIVSFAYKLAKKETIKKTCAICLEDKDIGRFFEVDNCLHSYCLSCMKRHVEVKIRHEMVAKCPHEGCETVLNIEKCRMFLSPELINIMTERLKEASIPFTEKVYCPYPKCSFLMTKDECVKYTRERGRTTRSGFRICMKCKDVFCVNCKVPWHYRMGCRYYKKRNPYPSSEDAELETLASRYLWRRCIKCNHMIERDTGCRHMTCRCGHVFCYVCGGDLKGGEDCYCSSSDWSN